MSRRRVLQSATALAAWSVLPFGSARAADAASDATATAPNAPNDSTGDSTDSNGITARLARYMVAAQTQPLPDDVMTACKHHILDTFGAMVSGARMRPGTLAVNYVRGLGGDYASAPDVVAYPRSEQEVGAVLDWAGGAQASVTPFGGGSSVVGGSV